MCRTPSCPVQCTPIREEPGTRLWTKEAGEQDGEAEKQPVRENLGVLGGPRPGVRLGVAGLAGGRRLTAARPLQRHVNFPSSLLLLTLQQHIEMTLLYSDTRCIPFTTHYTRPQL